jgi:hypothetical protein
MKAKLKFVVLIVSVLSISSTSAQSASGPQTMRWNPQSFSIGGRDLILIGGSMHYFRVPPEEWEGTFRRMHADGFNVVDTVIPWSIHEPEEGKVDFSTLQRFFDLAQKYGLYIVARPGPYICAEFDQGGYPRWLSGKGISYRSDSVASREWAKHWYDEIMPFLVRNQVSRGGPVVMVQLENEYGHPQYLSEEEKKEHLRFLWKVASSYGFDIPLMGNDTQFAQDMKDPILSQIYGTADAYFGGSYKNLERILNTQRQLNPKMPVGTAEYSMADPAATVRTMLGLGTADLDLYMFRGGSQFAYAAKGFEDSSYEVSAPVVEGGYVLPAYYPLKLAALFLRQFGSTLAQAEPAAAVPTADDPNLWVKQRNRDKQGFLLVREDSAGLDRLLKLQAPSQQHITYHDPQTGKERFIPQYSTMLLKGEQSRMIPLQLPVRGDSKLVYSTAELLGLYAYPQKSWLVFYGDPGEQAEAVVSFAQKPADLNGDAIWSEANGEAAYRMQFGDRDQVVSLTRDISLLMLSRQRAYRAQEWVTGRDRDLVILGADDTDVESKGDTATLHLRWRRPVGQVTVLSAQELASVRGAGKEAQVENGSGAQQFDAKLAEPNAILSPGNIRSMDSWSVGLTEGSSGHALESLPKLGVWKKGITHYHASFPGRDSMLRFEFFTDDYKAIYLNGKFVAEASNRARDAMAGSEYCPASQACNADIYYVDTARPKEDLGLWRMDEEKGLRAVEWLTGKTSEPLTAEWRIQFSSLDDLHRAAPGPTGLKVVKYSFSQPAVPGGEAVWRVHLPAVEALVYLNGRYLEHHQPEESVDSDGRPGIYLPPAMLQPKNNELLLVMLAPPSSNPGLPVIQADADSIRQLSTVVFTFKATPDAAVR